MITIKSKRIYIYCPALIKPILVLSLIFTMVSSWTIYPVAAQQSVPNTVQGFILLVVPWAQAEQQDSGVPASFSIAQAMHETGPAGWNPISPSTLAYTYHNFHGITCSTPNEGLDCIPLTNAGTGQITYWNQYSSGANGFLYHGRWLRGNHNYDNAFNYTNDTFRFAQEILRCYTGCGSPFPQGYYDDIVSKINNYNLQQYDRINSATVTDIPNPDTYTCSQAGFVDFEAFTEGTDLTSGTIAGLQFINTNGLPWIVGDFATGNYNGKYPNGAYTSGGTHWAWLGTSQGAGRINFPAGHASYFSLLVSDGTPVFVDAYDPNNTLLATAGPSSVNTSTGHMTELKITRASADMDYVMVHDQGNYFEVDDLCTNAPGTPNTIKRLVAQTYNMQTGQTVTGNFIVDLINGAKQLIHIIIGPFNSDVDLKLTRPDGSVVAPSDPGVTYNKTSTQVEVTIDNAQPGEWTYDIIANQLDSGGENIPIVVDEQTIISENQPPIISVQGDQTVQYSDPLSFNINATDPDDPGSALVFTGTGLPNDLSLIDNGDGTASVSGIAQVTPGSYTAEITVTDPGGLTDKKPVTIEVTAEDAHPTYSGPTMVSTGCATCTTVTIPLRATIQDITAVPSDPAYDPNPGDITKAAVTFVNRDNANAVLCTASPTLLDSADSKTGTATCNWTPDLGSSISKNFTVGTIVGGYYLRDSSADDTVIMVSKPTTNFILGAGYILNLDSAGLYAGTSKLKTDFGLGITFIKQFNRLIGSATIIVRKDSHIYLIESTTLSSLIVKPGTKGAPPSAELLTKAKIKDLTNPKKPITIMSDATLDITMKDYGEPGSNDTIGITVWGNNNVLLYSSSWTGNRTAEQKLGGGNLYIYLDKSITQTIEIIVPNSSLYLPLIEVK